MIPISNRACNWLWRSGIASVFYSTSYYSTSTYMLHSSKIPFLSRSVRSSRTQHQQFQSFSSDENLFRFHRRRTFLSQQDEMHQGFRAYFQSKEQYHEEYLRSRPWSDHESWLYLGWVGRVGIMVLEDWFLHAFAPMKGDVRHRGDFSSTLASHKRFIVYDNWS